MSSCGKFVLFTNFSESTNESKSVTPVDEEQPFFDQSDTEEMSEDSVHRVPRGIVNPNYPGFQHLAHTLQVYLILSLIFSSVPIKNSLI